MTANVKYIAEGFHEDAGKLLNTFTDRNTIEFSEFAAIWKKQNFSLVFMGRPDHTETSEFVNEAFRISSHFLSSPSFYAQVGAVYLLYALFRNQISIPPVKIRIEINQWRIIKSLRVEATLRKYNSLRYVIEYLIKNAFLYVFHQTLKGPLIGNMQKISKNHETVSNIRTTYKSEIMQYSISNRLEALRDLHTQYLAEKKMISNEVKVHLNAGDEIYENFISDLQDIVHPNKSNKDSETLGSRRAKLKAQSYLRKTHDRYDKYLENADGNNECDSDDNFSTRSERRKPIRKKRAPKHERKVGRPPKNPKKEPTSEKKSDDDTEVDISHLVSQQQAFYLPPAENECRKIRTRRDPYYKVSPKREEDNSSDPDDPS